MKPKPETMTKMYQIDSITEKAKYSNEDTQKMCAKTAASTTHIIKLMGKQKPELITHNIDMNQVIIFLNI